MIDIDDGPKEAWKQLGTTLKSIRRKSHLFFLITIPAKTHYEIPGGKMGGENTQYEVEGE